MERRHSVPGGHELEPGFILHDYRLESLVGGGGMGVVFRATQLTLGRRVALKIINPALAMQDDVRTRFVREARVGASVEHPNALPVYEVGDADGLLFISMRYVEGEDFATSIDREMYVDPDRAVNILSQVAAALDAAHAEGLVHRDVKPHNILIAKHGPHEHAYLTDFGLARHLLDTGLTATRQALGTPAYMSPEMVLGLTVDARSDVYSLGVVLFHALTGTVPFTAESAHAVLYKHVHEDVPRASAINTELGEGFDTVIARAMAKEPADRFPSTGDLALAAGAVLRDASTSRPEKSVATGSAAPVEVDPELEERFPARVTDAYIKAKAPLMTGGTFDAFLGLLRARNWNEHELESRVYPFAPAEWSSQPQDDSPAVVLVYESATATGRTRELLEVLPGGADSGLTPVELAELMKPVAGARLSAASIRAVMRNLQRLENRLLDERQISRRILGKRFDRYEIDQAGRYFLEEIDRELLDAHLGRADQESLPAMQGDLSEPSATLNVETRPPTAIVSRKQLERTAAILDDVEYRARIDGSRVVVTGAPLVPTWARLLESDQIEIDLGAKVPALLGSIDPGRHPQVIAGALIISAVVGHPRRDPQGGSINFVWTDHISLAASGDAAGGMDFSWVRDEQADHIRALAGRARVTTLGDQEKRPPSHSGPPEIQERVVLIRIPRLHKPGMSGLEMYEATRKWWVMTPHRHDPDFAFTVVDGTVLAVFRIDEWERDPSSGRWAFHGARDPRLEKHYVGLDVSKYLPHGAQNPIRYVNC